MKIAYILGFFAIVLLLTACQPSVNTVPNVTLEGAMITTGNQTINQTPELKINDSEDYGNVSYIITGTEGDLIKLELKAVDPDGDKLTYTYDRPFNDNGLWQTKEGDAGKYLVKVTVSDGKSDSSADVLVIVKPSNKAPIIDCLDDIRVKEGETVELKCNFFDKENDPLVIEYSGWMTSPVYTTNYDSAGKHKVFVTVSDGFHNVTKTINVIVDNVDRAPIFEEKLKDLVVLETDIVTLKPKVMDPDGDTIKLTYSEPFNSNGVWKTKIGDAGTYPISVVASSGSLTTKETFTLTVKMLNTAPVMKTISNITIEEGDTIILKPDVADREDDVITIKYTGWMKSSTYTTTYDDAYPKGCDKVGCSATYKVTVTASDGQYNVSQDVYITVKDKNRPPQFVWP
ncbi:MAG: hypothetical protein KatS3mg002_0716 [Candidatus Woesearchaeota archaeon]|nr:MAG: hypothetical protein KatS3mg002_0716 [Candidatus Woesearchaeota archaeon]